jgi:hypothetical protein
MTRLKKMKLGHVKKISCIFFGLTLLFASHAAAVYIIEDPNDPYNPDCPFDAAPGESVRYLHDFDSSDQLWGITVNTDLTIGQYIRDHYPDIWDMLSPVDQKNYNTLLAVFKIGSSTPVLPNTVKDLLAGNHATTRFSKSNGIYNLTLSGLSAPQLPGSASRITTTQKHQVLSSYYGGTGDTVATGYFSRGESSSKWNFNSALVTGRGYL